MRKKGSLPITVLVLGVVLVCGLVLLSFYSSTISLAKPIVGVGLIEKMNLEVERGFFEGSPRDHFELNKSVTKWNWIGKRRVVIISVEYLP